MSCQKVVKEPANEYDCKVFSDTGSSWAQGRFVLVNSSTTPPTVVAEPMFIDPVSIAEGFDGTRILLRGQQALVPDGWIQVGASRRVRYELGREAGGETE